MGLSQDGRASVLMMRIVMSFNSHTNHGESGNNSKSGKLKREFSNEAGGRDAEFN